MGCTIQKSRRLKFLQKKESFQISEPETEFNSKKIIHLAEPTDIDLPYRHYINPHQYIPSAMPHYYIQYHSHQNFRMNDIKMSTLMQRRNSELKEKLDCEWQQ